MTPPKATKSPKKLEKHGDIRVDNYFWMRERDTPRVLEHLQAENAYSADKLSMVSDLKEELLKEMKGREKREDATVPVEDNGYYYYVRYEEKSEYPIVCRRKGSLTADEEIILDANKVAKGTEFFSLGSVEVSPNGRYLAYATDRVGRRLYNVEFIDLKTKKKLPHKIENMTGSLSWTEDNKTIMYSKQDIKTLRHQWIYAFDIETGKNPLIFHEKDEKFYVGVHKSRSAKYMIISTGSSESSESWVIDAKKPLSKPRLFNKRRPKHEYDIAHAGKFFFVMSNKGAENFKVFRTPNNSKTDQSHWKTVVGHRKSVFIRSIAAFKKYLVLQIRKKGISEIELVNRKTGKMSVMKQPEKSHVVGLGPNNIYDTPFIRYSYQSMTTPNSVIDYDFKTKEKNVRKVKEVLGGFDKNNYASERITIKGHDDVKIPVSIVYRKGFKKDGASPLLLYGYGSYGHSIDPSFSATRLSLLDRGFVFAIAHVRGSSTMGRPWYLSGKYLKKKNSFKDFVSVADGLIKKKYTSHEHIYAMGGSAGGLLMGAVINMRPELFNGVVAAVPFVDVVSTMLDDSLPLTTNEYEEWGNPNKKKYYDYMKSYSPYDQVKKAAYPNLLVTSGYHDSQVQYWEPAKWVAKLRDCNTSQNLILLDTNLEAGHGGKSGRFKKLEDTAQDFAFLIGLEKKILK